MYEQPRKAASKVRTRWIVPMTPRQPDEEHRVSTPLELFFDLVFVVAISFAASGLHHGIGANDVGRTLLSYTMTFFGIWWAWMNFTWFASSYDTDDVFYRVLIFAQMTGALIFAAGVPQTFASGDLKIAVVGYVVMRAAAVISWARAALADREHRPAAIRYGVGIAVCQVGWVLLLFTPAALHVPGFFGLVIAELLVPGWAERSTPTTWHPHHIAERYGLFTIIVLGELVLSSVVAIQSTLDAHSFNTDLIPLIVGGLLILYTVWWLYFYQPAHDLLEVLDLFGTFVWAYGQLFIFAAVAALGSGLAVAVDQVTQHAEISAMTAGFAVAIPAAVYLISLWILQERPRAARWYEKAAFPLCALLVLLTPLTGQAVLLTGLLMAALLAVKLIASPTGDELADEA